ncbi:TetR/AcrR family transcriptional regulator [Amycolatopsis cynarae]|uniref:TetR/AcrR family transcriptional regulator n=1 Tax=Amycolatopsis cynarae TaxID=2995223 RepID=A0ABY7B8C8_9PSEU|nr:TetR/AcrR family transcriptional regulator [Amycolatopsis sp. HUAS 11-8]WAL68406.1 TetR/AcrR family transcriptional regulator [Amycolatopsis sp. HUAS 11-8]
MARQQTRSRAGRPPSVVAGQTVPQRLLAAATRLFAERGFEGTTVQDVVDAAGLTKGAMYHYFAAKDDLLFEIYASVLRLQMARMEKIAAEEGPVTGRLYEAAADVVGSTLDNFDEMVIFFRSLHQLSEQKQRRVERERQRYYERFCDLITEGQRSGDFRDDVNPKVAAHYFFGAVHHLSTWYRPGGALSPAQIGDSFAGMLLASLLPGRA